MIDKRNNLNGDGASNSAPRDAEAARGKATNDVWQPLAEQLWLDGHYARGGERGLAAVAVEHVCELKAFVGAHVGWRVAAAHLTADKRALEVGAEDPSTSSGHSTWWRR